MQENPQQYGFDQSFSKGVQTVLSILYSLFTFSLAAAASAYISHNVEIQHLALALVSTRKN